MSDETGREKDALGLYLSGADSDGGDQPDPRAALGNYRSATEAKLMGGLISNPIKPVVINKIFGSNGEGIGTIRTDQNGSWYYTAPGGSEGSGVTVPDGESRILQSSDTDKLVRVSRDGAVDVSSSMTIQQMEAFDNIFSLGNVATADRAAGVNRYTAVMMRAHGDHGVLAIQIYIGELGTSHTTSGQVLSGAGAGHIGLQTGNFNDWPPVGFAQVRDNAGTLKEIIFYDQKNVNTLTIGNASYRGLLGTSATAGASDDTIHAVPGIRIAGEAADGSNKIQTIADVNTAPAAVSWNTSITAAAGIQIASIDVDRNHGLWIQSAIPTNCVLFKEMKNYVRFKYYAA